jgi:adenylate cyclase
VVLPFANASGTSKDEDLAAALTDDFTIDLAQIRGAVVVARSRAQAIAARKLPLPAVGRELAVRYVLEGNIRRSPEGIEINVALSDAASATSIWAWQLKEAASEPGDLRLQVTQSLLFPLRTAFIDAEARRISSLPDADAIVWALVGTLRFAHPTTFLYDRNAHLGNDSAEVVAARRSN